MTMLMITALIGLAVESVHVRMHDAARGGALR